jgi:hypothetical protein
MFIHLKAPSYVMCKYRNESGLPVNKLSDFREPFPMICVFYYKGKNINDIIG